MKTIFAYVLVSDYTDYYWEQTLMSIYSIKLHHSNPKIVLVVDNITYDSLTGKRDAIIQYCSNIIKVDLPIKYNKVQRSRYLKTKLRHLIDGDYLFIDTDTIICSSLKEIDLWKEDIAAVLDNHGDKYSTFTENWIKDKINKMNWNDIVNVPHFNSGILYVKDTPNTRAFYEVWHSYWNECYENNIYIDQLSLRKTCKHLKYSIKELDGTWNCQIRYPKGQFFLNDAKVLHYQSSDLNYIYEIFNEITFLKIKYKGNISEEIHKMIESPKQYCKNKKLMISGTQIDFVQSPMYEIFIQFPIFFKIITYISLIYQKIKVSIWNIKNKLINIIVKL